ncbi:MAG: zinc-ribbon domain-containing protein [Comamonas sp.]|nr:zinc-ribbon domain-containing protein [Comamonas sp.]
MSLITRCPSCGTKFRVVADQLRISDGWVRCGRCQEVFDATQALEDALAPHTPVAASMPQEAAGDGLGNLSVTSVEGAPETASEEALSESQRDQDQDTLEERAHPGYELPAPPELDADQESEPASLAAPGVDALATRPMPAWEPASPLPAENVQAMQWSDAWLAVKTVPVAATASSQEAPLPLESGSVAAQDEDLTPHLGKSVDEEASAPVPGFVKQAQRKAWWNQPGLRFVIGMLVILLPVALLLQIALHERNNLVAWKPQWHTAFQAMCVALRCELAPRKHIASIVLTGSSFNQEAQPHYYRLGLSIQNQSSASVATPAVELTLTDTQGQTLVRKVLLPAEIGAPVELAAHSEWNGSLPIATQGLQLPVSGYRVLAFYP